MNDESIGCCGTAPGVMVLDLEGAILDWNAAAERMFGFAKADVVGKRPAEVLRPADGSILSMSAGIAKNGRWSGEVTVCRKDGSECAAEATALPLSDIDGRHPAHIVLYRDLTERKQLQARLLLADRMASLGILAAGMAHEINNPLAFVLGNLVYIADALPRGPGNIGAERLHDIQTAMRDAREGGERIRAIVRDLVTFARGREPDTGAPVDPNAVLQFAIQMADNEIRHRASLVKRLGPVPPVLGGESRLGQVFLNLLVNAAHAIPEGAAARNEIRVTTRTDPGPKRVVVEIADTGVGIAPEDLGRIFDPFFTTKPAGAGTGLGLSICHSILVSLGGDIAIESQPGRGTTVRVFLPVAELEPTARRDTVLSLDAGRARILVVDDEALVGEVIRRLLSPSHDVRALTRASEAYDLIVAGARFDLILCDLIMPDMTGMDLYGKLSAGFPEQANQVVFMTGGAFTDNARLFLDRRRNYRVVTKPIDLAELTAIVSEVLAARTG